ncbi:CapA family protein [Haloterrigena salifodinae]|uniref:CapA family protein n=1 Tax=Haloterrigena salifodinae TaxID=2675099 RepID=A0A8T8E366_9EURY|nr:CapA family protein [Haloterrigena salifodinae]QRV15993.1 CapA family protein [Haloterrigena salifodinae]
MSRHRRTFLATAGAVAIGGCAVPEGDLAVTDDRGSATDRDGGRGETTIGFAGDTMLGRELNRQYGRSDVDPAAVWGDLRPRLESLDGVCCNLECCLSMRGEPAPGRTYHFRGDPEWAVPALSAGNVQFASLANNHAMDFGPVSLTDTIDALTEAGIDVAGAGETPAAARAPATFSVGDVDVAVVSFADRYAGYAATDGRPGIAHIAPDPSASETRRVVGDAIERAKATDPDLLVASVHFGPNWVERPSGRLVAFGHRLVDRGVDLVHGHSSHVVQGIERYGDGVVLHDTGDFVDDFGVKDGLQNDRSYLFEATLEDGELREIQLVPIEIDDGVSRAGEDAAAWLRETMRARSAPFETTYERDGEGLVVPL